MLCKCANCGKIHEKDNRRVRVENFCCLSCRKEHFRKGRLKKCITCGSEFIPRLTQLRAGIGKFCSKKCTRTLGEVSLGDCFGELKVISLDCKKIAQNRTVMCQCSCGRVLAATISRLKRGEKTSCGQNGHHKRTNNPLTQKRLKKLVVYDELTGIFTYRYNGRTTGGLNNESGYHLSRIDGKQYRSHRLAFLYMEGKFPKGDVDHINHNRADNRWENLRQVSSIENARNRSRPKSESFSGMFGVNFDKRENRWKAFISVKNKTIGLGAFRTKIAASYARHCGNIKYGFHENHGK